MSPWAKLCLEMYGSQNSKATTRLSLKGAIHFEVFDQILLVDWRLARFQDWEAAVMSAEDRGEKQNKKKTNI